MHIPSTRYREPVSRSAMAVSKNERAICSVLNRRLKSFHFRGLTKICMMRVAPMNSILPNAVFDIDQSAGLKPNHSMLDVQDIM
jgi:hypothetical protein